MISTQMHELTKAVQQVWGPSGRPQRVLLLGNYGNGNSGDEAILAGLLQTVPRDTEVTVLSRHADAVTALQGVPAVRTLSWESVRACVRADRLVVGGGGMFGAGLPTLVAILPFVLLLSRLLGKQVAFAAIGAYQDTPTAVRLALQRAAQVADAVTVRDGETALVLGRHRATPPVVVGDPAVLVEPASTESVRKHVPPGLLDTRPLVVSLKAMPDPLRLERTLTLLGAALAPVARQGVPIVLLCMSRKTDYGLDGGVSDRMLSDRMNLDHLHGGAHVLGPDLPPQVVRTVIAAARGVISMRLHPQIFATTSAVPQLPIVFEPKSAAWCQLAGQDFLPCEELLPGHVAEWLSRVLV